MSSKKPQERSSQYMLLLFGVIIIASLGLRAFQTVKPAKETDLLPIAAGRMIYTSKDDLPKQHQFPLPEKTFSSALTQIGVYTNGTKQLPINSVIAVYVRDGARFSELAYLPNTTRIAREQLYKTYPSETVVLSESQTGQMIHLRNGYDCSTATEEKEIQTCHLTNTLIFEKENGVYQLSSDGNHATEGELIEMARSIP